MTTTILKISGMTCGHCARAVTEALRAVPGVGAVQVNLDSNEAIVQGDAAPGQLIAAVKVEGYGAQAANA